MLLSSFDRVCHYTIVGKTCDCDNTAMVKEDLASGRLCSPGNMFGIPILLKHLHPRGYHDCNVVANSELVLRFLSEEELVQAHVSMSVVMKSGEPNRNNLMTWLGQGRRASVL